ncbi:hypothetical protein [Paenibacillus thalictri]|uniref:DUF4139 domain-containing protein n=1 Tax=Paenibacillus thalictri TaxID=2527873 RepID=A0A4Q9DZ08_9BACL|nr:hypothetical protein [Paenibacillus thalictri]TBL81705.1 hypothetical protein EYB31_01525 [Paenibacillus thalictri]
MKKYMKKTLSAAVIASLLLSFPYSAAWADDAGTAVVVDNRYPVVLSDALQVKVTGMLSEHTLDGTRLAATVKMYNVTGDTVRVPDYEVRALAANGAKYTLRGSADNVVNVPPMSSIELIYYAQIDIGGEVAPADLLWIDVNKDVYPKVETTMLDLPVANLVWHGDSSWVSDASAIKAWGETFTIPSLDSPLTYTPVSLTTDYKSQNPVKVMKLLAENPGGKSEKIPNFSINGRSASQVFKGTRADQTVTALDPGEKKYIYYAIPTDLDTELQSFTISTPHSFKIPNRTDAAAQISYSIGRLSVSMPTTSQLQAQEATPPTSYTVETVVPIDPLNTAINPNISVSVVDLQLYENKGMGYQTGLVKLRFKNRSDKPLPVPQFAAELVGGGFTYAGTRLNAAATMVAPDTDYALAYSFVLPLDGVKDAYTLRLVDDKTAAPYRSTFGQVGLAVNKPRLDNAKLLMYPFEVSIKDWSLSNNVNLNQTTRQYEYMYRLKITFDLKSVDPVFVDSNYNKLLIELENKVGRKVASTTVSLNGDNRMINGEQLINFYDTGSDQLEYPLVLKLYETIDTPSGPARRLMASMQQ